MKIELLWFEDCPNHEAAEEMLAEILAELRVGDRIDRIEVPDLETGKRLLFPGSPTIRINGDDVEARMAAMRGLHAPVPTVHDVRWAARVA